MPSEDVAMSEEVKCKSEFDEWLKKTTEWVDKQREMLEIKPTPDKVEEVARIYEEVVRKGKDFGKCELAQS